VAVEGSAAAEKMHVDAAAGCGGAVRRMAQPLLQKLQSVGEECFMQSLTAACSDV
jgi:hypothetical protein